MKTKILPADRAFSNCLRMSENWTCQRCGQFKGPGSKGLHTAHIFSRRHRATRWLPMNCMVLCMGCHRQVDENHELKRKFAIEMIGQENYEKLLVWYQRIIKYTKQEQGQIGYFYRKKLMKMEPGDDMPVCSLVMEKINDSEPNDLPDGKEQ